WAVAKICAELHLDDPSLAAALLHDVVEDTDVEPDDLRSEFGDEIAQLVEGVTKLTRTSFQTREQSDAENYRKMIVAMAQDVRVILIKLADRIYNMRTIKYPGKQAQVRRDLGEGGRSPRRPRGGRLEGGRGARRGAGEGGHPRRDRRPREALLL